jgi:hypothetical protein
MSEVDFGPSGRDSNSNHLIRSHNLPSYVLDLRILIPALFRQIKHFYHFEPGESGQYHLYAANQSSSQWLFLRASISASKWPTPAWVQN